MNEKYCNKCETTKPITQFNKKTFSADGFQPYCKDCCAAMSAKSYRRRKKILARAGATGKKQSLAPQKKQPKRKNGSMVLIVPMDKAKELLKEKLPLGGSVFVVDAVAAGVIEQLCDQCMQDYVFSFLK